MSSSLNSPVTPRANSSQSVVKVPTVGANSTTKSNNSSYEKCLSQAQDRFDQGKLKLCPRGYCTAKHKFEVYPSAYANGYASQVCKGSKPDYLGETSGDDAYLGKLEERKETESSNPLQRWFKEDWRNVCETDADGNYLTCGRKKASLNPKDYPYCRPKNKLEGTTVKSIDELSQDEINRMCAQKRSIEPGVDGKPTRVYV